MGYSGRSEDKKVELELTWPQNKIKYNMPLSPMSNTGPYKLPTWTGVDDFVIQFSFLNSILFGTLTEMSSSSIPKLCVVLRFQAHQLTWPLRLTSEVPLLEQAIERRFGEKPQTLLKRLSASDERPKENELSHHIRPYPIDINKVYKYQLD